MAGEGRTNDPSVGFAATSPSGRNELVLPEEEVPRRGGGVVGSEGKAQSENNNRELKLKSSDSKSPLANHTLRQILTEYPLIIFGDERAFGFVAFVEE